MNEIEEYERSRPTGGLYDLPVVGRGFRQTREFFDEMEPRADDSTGVVVGKQAIRYGTVAGATVAGLAAGCILAL